MLTYPLTCVTIVAEPVLQEHLLADLRRLGARGWTITESQGEGSRGLRASDPPGAGIRIEAILPPETAMTILEHVAEAYFPHYAVIAWTTEVRVVRGDKYV